MTDLEIAKTLKDAAQYIRDDPDRWYQGALEDGEGRLCGVGVLRKVCDPNYQGGWDIPAAGDAAHVACDAALGYPHMDLSTWNDTPGRTTAEVIDLFESVALQHELRALAGAGGVESADVCPTPTLPVEAGRRYATSLRCAP